MSYGGAFLFLLTGRHEQVAGAIRLVVILIFDVKAVFGNPCREVPPVVNYIDTACFTYRWPGLIPEEIPGCDLAFSVAVQDSTKCRRIEAQPSRIADLNTRAFLFYTIRVDGVTHEHWCKHTQMNHWSCTGVHGDRVIGFISLSRPRLYNLVKYGHARVFPASDHVYLSTLPI